MKFKNMKLAFLTIVLLFSCAACEAFPVFNLFESSSKESTLATTATAGSSETPQGGTPSKIPVIFSHDGAPDDIAAMLYLSKNPAVEIIGVVNSYGEQVPRESSQEWAAYLYEILDLDTVPLAIGSETPLDPAGYAFPESWRTAANDFWGVQLPATNRTIDPRPGYQLIIDLVSSSTEKVTLLVTGAQTDVALALQHAPQIKNHIERIVIMGGAFYVAGNLNGNAGSASNEAAEWNIFVDALAAKQVFNSGVPLTIVPLDGSENFWITHDMADQLSGSEDAGVNLLSQLWQRQFEMWNGDFLIWDILAAVSITDAQYFVWENGDLDVISEEGEQHGQTLVLDGSNRDNEFAVGNDYEGLATHILDSVLAR